MTRKPLSIAAAAVLALVAIMVHLAEWPASEVHAQDSVLTSAAVGATVRAVVGIGDAEPTDWSGSVIGDAELSIDGESVSGSWELESESAPLKVAGGERIPRVLPTSIIVAPQSSAGTLEVDTAQGKFSIHPGELELGNHREALDSRVRLEALPSGGQAGTAEVEEDFVSALSSADGTTWLAYTSYERGGGIDESAALDGRFDSIEFNGNGDQVMLAKMSGGQMVFVSKVSPSLGDVSRPALGSSAGGIAITWSEQRHGNWDVYSRSYNPANASFESEQRITDDPGQDINVVAAAGYVAWQGRRGDNFDIFAAKIGEEPVRVSTSKANDWQPSIAVDSSGAAWIAWDTYDAGNYDVYLRKFDGTKLGKPIAIAASPRFEARASVSIDNDDRVWVAFEDSGPNWGKDYGDRWPGRRAIPFYVDRNILVRVWDGRLRTTANPFRAPTVDYFSDDPRVATSQRHKISIPVMKIDAKGRPWLFYRMHPLQTGSGELWRGYAAYYEGGEWSSPIELPGSDYLIDRRPSVVTQQDGSLMAVYAGDQRKSNVRDRQDSDVFYSRLSLPNAPTPPTLKNVNPKEPRTAPRSIHENETADIARMRAARLDVGGKQLRYLRGEFHRHTEFSAHRDWDGPFEEIWRYALDVADMDWLGPGDHDYAVGQDYLWWLQQKASDMYHLPGKFNAMYTYERSARYPSGHRNVIFPRRGIRPLPRSTDNEYNVGTEQDGSADIKNLYKYLERFDAITSSHTSATRMGTDWRDANAELEPIVEIFQGHRQSYEENEAPMAASRAEDSIGGYQPKGFIWEAFKKGRRLGFQASSDHISTHISYAIVIAEDHSREGIIAAFKKRHSYGAQDNILLEVRSGEHMMGDEFESSDAPRLMIKATGTTAVDRVDIVRQVGTATPEYVASFEPRKQKIDIAWSDPAAAAGEINMYYVRLQQRNKALAWASPIWIDYKP